MVRDRWSWYGSRTAIAFIVAVLVWRTGLVPAASCGDEIWWSESAYQFLQHDVLRWGCLDDANGSALVSYWPPIAPLIQSAMLKTFGVTAFGICAQSTLIAVLLLIALYTVARRLGFDSAKSGWASCAAFGLFMVERRIVQVRMENLTALAVLVFAALWTCSFEQGGALRRSAAAGFVAAIGMLCYYPQAPFLLLAIAAAVLISGAGQRRLLAAFAGAFPVLAAAVAWIAPHWTLFHRQVIDAGTTSYWSWGNITWPFRQLTHVNAPEACVQQVEKWAVLAVGCAAWRWSARREVRAVGAMTTTLSLPMFAYVDSPQVAAGVLGVLTLAALRTEISNVTFRRSSSLVLGSLVISAIANTTLIAVTAGYQRDGRDYAVVAAKLKQVVNTDGPVAIGQRAWLGLRTRVGDPQLQFLPYNGPSLRQRPVVATRPDADKYFATLVLERSNLPAIRSVYPWIARALDSGEFALTTEIVSTWKPLPWARDPCYDLLVYRRTRAAPK